MYMYMCNRASEEDDVDSITTKSAVLGDFLVFLRRVAVTSRVKTQLCGARWLDVLLLIVNNRSADGATLGLNLRCRLLCLHLLKVLLPFATHLPEREHLPQVMSQPEYSSLQRPTYLFIKAFIKFCSLFR